MNKKFLCALALCGGFLVPSFAQQAARPPEEIQRGNEQSAEIPSQHQPYAQPESALPGTDTYNPENPYDYPNYSPERGDRGGPDTRGEPGYNPGPGGECGPHR